MLVVGLVVGSIGASCVEDNLPGVDHCHFGLGVTMTSVGWSGVGVVLLVAAMFHLPRRYADRQVRKTPSWPKTWANSNLL